MGDRPILVTILGVLYILVGLVSLLAFPVGIISAIVCIVIGYGMLKGWKIMWYLGVIFAVIGIIVSIPGIFAGVGIVTLIIEIIILYYLFRPNVKSFFLG